MQDLLSLHHWVFKMTKNYWRVEDWSGSSICDCFLKSPSAHEAPAEETLQVYESSYRRGALKQRAQRENPHKKRQLYEPNGTIYD